ncbi:DUF1294 domain-containing protein [Exiguobacterium sp. s78]|uniref:DUF1294 domain-containing protein n=1 Tax=Exiguobacterium sp. s78 TaxID=2751197 RepID=UPI001BE98E76
MILGYYLLLTLIGFVSMWQDKRRARQHAYRTPEATLLTIAFLGGALGSWIGMYTVRHKTRKAKFQWLVPMVAVLHLTFWFVYTSQ